MKAILSETSTDDSEIDDIESLSNKKFLKRFAADPYDNEFELFKRLEFNAFTDAEIVEICMMLLKMRDVGEW